MLWKEDKMTNVDTCIYIQNVYIQFVEIWHLFFLCHDWTEFPYYILILTVSTAYFGAGSPDLSFLYVNMTYLKIVLEAMM